jgi:predicted MFS family arabinose efflux permease
LVREATMMVLGGQEGRRLLALMVTAFVDTLGSFLVLALLPFYAEDFGASPQGVGLLVASFAFAQMLSAPLWGRLSDRWGRRPVILLGLLLLIGSFVAFALASSLSMLLVSRLAQGVAAGTVSVVFAYISESVAPERRTEGIGWVTAATSAAAMIGPVIGSLAGRLDPRYPGLIAAALAAIGLVIAWFLLPEPRMQGSVRRTSPSLLRALVSVASEPTKTAHVLIWIYALAMLSTSALTAVAGLFLERRFGVDEGSVWWFYSWLAAVSLLARLIVLGPAVRRLGEIAVLRSGAFLFAGGLLVMPLPDHPAGVAVAVALVAIGSSFLYPCTTSLVSQGADAGNELGQIMGVQQAYGGLSRIGGPIAAGMAFQYLGASSPLWAAGLVVVGIAAISVLALDRQV